MRVYALYLLVGFLSLYAYRDWFKSLCGLILLMAVLEHPDLPKNILGIQGMNPWNVLLVNVLLGWLIARRREGLLWVMPKSVNALLIMYLLVVLIGFARMMADRSHLDQFTTAYLVSENLINTIKWVIPALLVFDGCRSPDRIRLTLVCLLLMYGLLAIQVIRWMPASAAFSGAELEARSRKLILNEIGYHRVNMSAILAGASWAILSTIGLFKSKGKQILVVIAFLCVTYAQALTGGRMGYVTWGCVGFCMCMLRWKKALVLFPIAVVMVAVLLPGVTERMFRGFGAQTLTGESATDTYAVTAGRAQIWPHVIDKIAESPMAGYGRLAMQRTGLAHYLMNEVGESFSHPHNAYLQLLLDNGFLGAVPILAFYGLVVARSSRLFRRSTEPWLATIGGVCLALLLALLFASMGSQSFYPREGALGVWVAMCLCLRFSYSTRFTPLRSAGTTVRSSQGRKRLLVDGALPPNQQRY